MCLRFSERVHVLTDVPDSLSMVSVHGEDVLSGSDCDIVEP